MIFYENDSTDDTRKMLREFFTNTSYATVITENGMRGTTRTNRLAYARNRVLDIVQTQFTHYDFMIMTDMDGDTSHMPTTLWKTEQLAKFLCWTQCLACLVTKFVPSISRASHLERRVRVDDRSPRV